MAYFVTVTNGTHSFDINVEQICWIERQPQRSGAKGVYRIGMAAELPITVDKNSISAVIQATAVLSNDRRKNLSAAAQKLLPEASKETGIV